MSAITDSISDDYRRLWAHLRPESSRRLLLAALDAFAARGFQGATTRDISMRAGMSPAAVYVHYRSKTDLLYEIIRTGHDALWEDVSTAVGRFKTPPERLRAFVEAFAMFHVRFHMLTRVAQYELAELSPEQLATIVQVRRRIEQLLEDELQRGADEGVFEVSDLRGTVFAILSMGIDVARWYRPSRKRSGPEISGLLADLTLRMVRPDSTTARM
jgi:AcrR family transcriptional regulator